MKRVSLFLLVLLILVSGLSGGVYFTRTSDLIVPETYEGIILQCDSTASSALYNVRKASSFQVSVNGIDSTLILVYLYVGGREYLPRNGQVIGIDTSLVDSTKAKFTIDTITADGVYLFQGYMGTAVQVKSTKKDNGITTRLNHSTYHE